MRGKGHKRKNPPPCSVGLSSPEESNPDAGSCISARILVASVRKMKGW